MRILPAVNVPAPPGPVKTGPDSWSFSVWAPHCGAVNLQLYDPQTQVLPMQPDPSRSRAGWWIAEASGLRHSQRYGVVTGRHTRPDPASHWQPDGVHWPSALVDHDAFTWTESGFVPPRQDELIVYELHVGCFTRGGGFDSAVARLDHLAKLGVNAIEVMPVAQCPGDRNWGYDGVSLYAVQQSYGGPMAFKRFVDACHARGMAVILDVVYNHLGPEGNYLSEFGPYFSNKIRTPWGEAVNFDGPDSDPVRDFFIANAIHWFENYRIDGLRLDAVHAIHDERPLHFLAQLSLAVHRYAAKKPFTPLLIAETHANDPALVTPVAAGGYGMDAAWSDDHHHSLHSMLTGERQGYYVDYGSLDQVAATLARGFYFCGQFSRWNGRAHGLPADHLPGETFVVFNQTHDMVGNRPGSERLSSLAPREAQYPAAALLLLGPYIPMLFMGEEWGETAPFFYFTDHGDPGLARAVRFGRTREFAGFGWKKKPPDPQKDATFLDSKLDWSKLEQPESAGLLRWTQELIRLRREHPALRGCDRSGLRVWPFCGGNVLVFERAAAGLRCVVVCNCSNTEQAFDITALLGKETMGKALLLAGSQEERFGGPGQRDGPGITAESIDAFWCGIVEISEINGRQMN